MCVDVRRCVGLNLSAHVCRRQGGNLDRGGDDRRAQCVWDRGRSTPCVVCCHPHVLVVIAATGGTVTGSATAPRKHCLQENISESGSVGGKK